MNDHPNVDDFQGDEVKEQVPDDTKKSVATFKKALEARQLEFVALLPQHVSRERFFAVAVEAVRQNPSLLQCNARSLFGAVAKAARDGLMPDGREGVITPYKGAAQWNPMVLGLRRRARELDDMIVDADAVYANDTFEHQGGDNPKIDHRRPPLGQDRGALVGAYAIFRRGSEILYREVMDFKEIEAARAQSRAPDSLMWTQFKGEAYKKVVVRRGFKTVQCSEKLEEIVRREDEQYDFADKPAPFALPPSGESVTIEAKAEPEPAPEPEAKPKRKRAKKADTARETQAKPEAAGKPAPHPATPPSPKGASGASEGAGEGLSLAKARTMLFKAATKARLKAAWDEVSAQPWSAEDRASLEAYRADRERSMGGKR